MVSVLVPVACFGLGFGLGLGLGLIIFSFRLGVFWIGLVLPFHDVLLFRHNEKMAKVLALTIPEVVVWTCALRCLF